MIFEMVSSRQEEVWEYCNRIDKVRLYAGAYEPERNKRKVLSII